MNRRNLLGSGMAAMAAGGAGAAEGPGYCDLFAGTSRVLRYQIGQPDGVRAQVPGACYTHPLHSPAGDTLTDVGPADHPHHRGVFCAWVHVEGETEGDWWGWGALAPAIGRAIVNVDLETDGAGYPEKLRAVNSWQALSRPVIREELHLQAGKRDGLFVADYDYRFTSAGRPAVLKTNPFGGFCYRARPRGRVEVWGPDGVVSLANSVHNRKETNWPAAPFYDLVYTTAQDGVNGCAVLDHPENPKATWHVVRGIHMLNPCIVAEKEVVIEPDRPLRLRYRLVTHEGEPPLAALRRLHAEMAGGPSAAQA